jgi:hypothetical protein
MTGRESLAPTRMGEWQRRRPFLGNCWPFPSVSGPLGHQPLIGPWIAYQTTGHQKRPFSRLAHGTLCATWATMLMDKTTFPCQGRLTDVGHVAYWADRLFGLALRRNGLDAPRMGHSPLGYYTAREQVGRLRGWHGPSRRTGPSPITGGMGRKAEQARAPIGHGKFLQLSSIGSCKL